MTIIQEECIADTTVQIPADCGHWLANIVVVLKTYESGRRYYYIDYEWTAVLDETAPSGKTWDELVKMEEDDIVYSVISDVIPDKNSIISLRNAHPFYSNGVDLDDGYDGEIIAQNEMTDLLVKHLTMDDHELGKHSGSATAPHYRVILMHNINSLWD